MRSFSAMPLETLMQLSRQMPPGSPQALALSQIIAEKMTAGQMGKGIGALADQPETTVDLPLPQPRMGMTQQGVQDWIGRNVTGPFNELMGTFGPGAPSPQEQEALRRMGKMPAVAVGNNEAAMRDQQLRQPDTSMGDEPPRYGSSLTRDPTGHIRSLTRPPFRRGMTPQQGSLPPVPNVDPARPRTPPVLPLPEPLAPLPTTMPSEGPPPATAGGIGALPPVVEQALSQMQPGTPQVMKPTGLMAMQRPPAQMPNAPVAGAPSGTRPDYMGGIGSLQGQIGELEKMRQQILAQQANRPPAWGDAALAAGIGMMSSDSPNWWQQLGAGGQAALGALNQRKAQEREALMTAYEMQRGSVEDRLKIAELRQRGEIAKADALDNAARTRAYVKTADAQAYLAKKQAADLDKPESDLERLALKLGGTSSAWLQAAQALTSSSNPLISAYARVFGNAYTGALNNITDPDVSDNPVRYAKEAARGFAGGLSSGFAESGPASGVHRPVRDKDGNFIPGP